MPAEIEVFLRFLSPIISLGKGIVALKGLFLRKKIKAISEGGFISIQPPKTGSNCGEDTAISITLQIRLTNEGEDTTFEALTCQIIDAEGKTIGDLINCSLSYGIFGQNSNFLHKNESRVVSIQCGWRVPKYVEISAIRARIKPVKHALVETDIKDIHSYIATA